MSSLPAAIAERPVVVDGGLGTLLEARGHDLSSPLWSARLLADDPEAIRRAHAEFFAAGAEVAITSSYQVSYEGMDAAGATPAEVDALLRRSIDLARRAADGERDRWVAASVGPYGAARADGSEYTGAYGLTVAELRGWHRRRLRVLAAAGPDVLALETVPSLREVEALCRELDGLGVPAWLSVTVSGGALRTGESLADAVAIAAATPEVVALGVNCCCADEVVPALAVVRAAGAAGVAYPNSGERWNAAARRWSGDAASLHREAGAWVDAGARLIGGCCRIGPAGIEALARALAEHSGRLAAAPAADPSASTR